MFEERTFENILGSMLSYVAEKNTELDVREGSVIYTALAPIALELESVYHELDMVLEETFLETASKEYLVKHGNQIGMTINEATFGHFVGEFNVDVEIGSRFNLDEFNYNVIDKLSDPTDDNPYYRFELVCETEGSEPNGHLGTLTPITYVSNLSYAELESVIIYGEDEEDTEAYRYRLQIHLKNPPTDGNIAQYNEWLDEYDGVGKYRVTPCWNGANTIKLTVLNSENRRADDTIVQDVQEHFDPPTSAINDDTTDVTYPQGRGMGNGVVPIGAIVTVDTVTEVPVTITCELRLKNGYSSPIEVVESVQSYFESIALTKNLIAYMPISAAIYNTECVGDIVSLRITVKGQVMDTSVAPFIDHVAIGDGEIAVLDTVNSVWGV
jgi:uncharacterized phage protein gp47/JayE